MTKTKLKAPLRGGNTRVRAGTRMSVQEDTLCPYIGNLCQYYINMLNITISLTPKFEAPIAVAMAVQPYAISSAIRHSSKHESSRPPATSQ
jgi:hypothetical protein